MAYTFMSSIMIEGLRGAIAARTAGATAGFGRLGDIADKATLSDESTHGSAADVSDLADAASSLALGAGASAEA